MPDSQRTVHTVQRPNGEQLTAQVSTFKGKDYVGIRSFYQDRTSGEFAPGKNGLSVAPTELPSVLICVLKLVSEQGDDVQAVCRTIADTWLNV